MGPHEAGRRLLTVDGDLWVEVLAQEGLRGERAVQKLLLSELVHGHPGCVLVQPNDPVPPLAVVNDLLRQGGTLGGTAGWWSWLPFEIGELQHDLLAMELLDEPFHQHRAVDSPAWVTDLDRYRSWASVVSSTRWPCLRLERDLAALPLHHAAADRLLAEGHERAARDYRERHILAVRRGAERPGVSPAG